ncbi:MAG TPA: hypothetical protein DDZ80_12500 [Cyanobacteria bacterium UBA8803]|nr:hypothetical protein [Cyanobacteria bacterium UBA9273]HBL59298.1 hypothetical protein [Cyanobacteria bacterium UBA8803]
MLRPESSRIDPPEREEPNLPNEPATNGSGGVDIQRELNRLEEMLFDSFHIPFTGRTVVEEEAFLAQLDLVRENLPDAFEKAQKIVREREEILLQAEEYAQEIIESAEHRADELIDEVGIIQQAELEAQQIRQQVQQECEAMREQALAEIEQMRDLALAECEDIQNGADDYADAVLNSIERQLGEMLRVVRNGRQQLHGNSQSGQPPETEPPPNASGSRPAQPPPKK